MENKVKLEFLTQNYQIQFWGSSDHAEPEWQGSVAASKRGLLIGTANEDSPFFVEFVLLSSASNDDEVYFSTIVDAPEKGLELFLVEDSDFEMEPGNLGDFLKLPWSGDTLLELKAPEGFEEDSSKLPCPISLRVYLSPNQE
jgi:hypothetical protein